MAHWNIKLYKDELIKLLKLFLENIHMIFMKSRVA